MTLQDPSWLQALWLCVPVLLLVLTARRATARALRAFAPAFQASHRRSRLGVLTAPLTLALLALSLTRPGVDPRPLPSERAGRDVLFVVDVSRSMLAREGQTSRLQRATLAIRDALTVAAGDRIGLVAFAGDPRVLAPPTIDYAFLRLMLDEVGPESTTFGGTDIGRALDLALAVLSRPGASGSRDIVLFTDGEDHAGQALAAARRVGAAGVRLITVGMGSTQGTIVPIDSSPAARPFTYEGQPVVSRMDPQGLRPLSEATPGGVFIEAGAANIEFDEVYERVMRGVDRERVGDETSVVYRELYQVLLAAALAVLALSAWSGGGGRVRGSRRDGRTSDV